MITAHPRISDRNSHKVPKFLTQSIFNIHFWPVIFSSYQKLIPMLHLSNSNNLSVMLYLKFQYLQIEKVKKMQLNSKYPKWKKVAGVRWETKSKEVKNKRNIFKSLSQSLHISYSSWHKLFFLMYKTTIYSKLF